MSAPSHPLLPDFFTAQSDIPLTGESPGPVFGRSVTRYEIHKRRDVLNQQSNLGYILFLRQRVMVPNPTPYQPGPSSATTFNNYPAILVNSLQITANNGAALRLESIFPRTLNSSVSTSTMVNDNTSRSQSREQTSGSSQSTVNTFGVALSAGLFGDIPTASLTVDASHSWENGTMRSNTAASGTGGSHGIGASVMMSMKDWSSFGALDASSVNPTWVFGQSFPWDVILYNQSTNGSNINLPDFVKDRLAAGNIALPPSDISQFGLEFAMTATWLIDFPKGVRENETIQVAHTTMSFTASHGMDGTSVYATLQTPSAASQATYSSGPLDLSTYSLIPLHGSGPENGSAIGFRVNPFTIAPSDEKSAFKIASPSNTLQVAGSGFDETMTSRFTRDTKLTLTFKILDTADEYALHLMHWVGPESGPVQLAWKVNGKWSGVIYVDSTEGSGGQGNVSTLVLRDTDFSSINFHDYLVIGANNIELAVSPVKPTTGGASANPEYSLVAASIGKP